MLPGRCTGKGKVLLSVPQYLVKSWVPAVCQVQRSHSGMAGTGHLAFLCAWKGVQLSWLILWFQIEGTFQPLVEHG